MKVEFPVKQVSSINIDGSIPDGYDGIVLVTDSLEKVIGHFEALLEPLKKQAAVDDAFLSDGGCLPINLPAKRLIYSPTGPLNRDYDDIRRYEEAAASGMTRALKAGIKSPLLIGIPDPVFEQAELVILLGALRSLYVPLEIREDVPSRNPKIEKLGFFGMDNTINLALALESGRIVARDIGGSDPERMSPPKVEEYVREVFHNSPVTIEVVDDDRILCQEYPLFSAVNRCAKVVERHRGRIIYLTYEGSGPVERTLMLVGKGVTYDTGGADVKAGGIMASMHRDKCGAAAIAGFMKTVVDLKPKNLKVRCGLAVVRNSIGSNGYVADEIITSRAAVRVRVGNTDAEGRMAMADVLSYFKEQAFDEVSPYLMTIATLTGHQCLAHGEGYSAIMDNGPAHQDMISHKVQAAGDEMADPFEISTIRREDYNYHKGRSEYEDVLQAGNNSSSCTDRGHQHPAAFLIMASGLDKHGKDSPRPLRFSHLDIAGSSGPFPGIPTGAPILALSKAFMPQAFCLV